jgi:hypothetical protein
VSESVGRPELEHAIREFVAGVRGRALRDERPLLDRLPADLIAAVQQGIADYLPIAVERLGSVLADPEARERIRAALKRALDHALRQMMVHERVMARLVITERRIDRALGGLEGGGLTELIAVFEAPEFRAQVAQAVNDAVVRFLRTPLAQRLWALGPDRLDGVERAAADFIVRALRAPETRAWAVERARQAIAIGREALTGTRGREWVREAAHAAVRAMLERPLGWPADYFARRRARGCGTRWPSLCGRDAGPGAGGRLAVGPGDGRAESARPPTERREIIKGVTQREP